MARSSMRWILPLLVALAGCVTDGPPFSWNLDAESCARAHGATVVWVALRADGAILEKRGFPCAQGEGELGLPYTFSDWREVAGLYDASSQLVAKCDVELTRHGRLCDFPVP